MRRSSGLEYLIAKGTEGMASTVATLQFKKKNETRRTSRLSLCGRFLRSGRVCEMLRSICFCFPRASRQSVKQRLTELFLARLCDGSLSWCLNKMLPPDSLPLSGCDGGDFAMLPCLVGAKRQICAMQKSIDLNVRVELGDFDSKTYFSVLVGLLCKCN